MRKFLYAGIALSAAPLLMLLVALLYAGPGAAAQSNVTNFTNLRTTGYLRADTFVRIAPRAAISVTGSVPLTPTGSYQRLESAGTVTVTAIAAGTAGDLLILVNAANTTINLSDTLSLRLGSNRALGQHDTLMLLSDGTGWNELSYTNN